MIAAVDTSTAVPTELAPPVLGQTLTIELMNTIWADRHGMYDSLATAAGAKRWVYALGERAPIRSGLTPQCRDDLRELRGALRQVAAHLTAHPHEHPDRTLTEVGVSVQMINEKATHVLTTPTLALHPNGAISTDNSISADALPAAIAASAIAFYGSEQAAALRACLAPGCVLYFVKDHPRRGWCSPACGNRARAARHYARHHP